MEPYQSLYRRFRPQRFAEVRGQEHVTRALRNAVRDGRVAHAYLFSGPRGTGKTSTARILAMALNCEAPVDGEPDGTCASCVEIRRGASLDVHELDAASNRRIDEMRELLSRVALGTRGRTKVYIVDEVHQLTADASSALLKTLEEPPAHVVFVLATTDPQKVLDTIRSRTQHFEFRLLGADVLAHLVAEVNEQAGLGVAAEAIDVVVRRGAGSARDALSALDQVAALGEVTDDTASVSGIVDAVADRDPGAVLASVAEAVAAGADPRRLLSDVVAHLRNGFLAVQAPSLLQLPDDAADDARRQARQLGLPALVRAIETLGEAAVALRDSVDPRVTLEVALVRLAAPGADPGVEGLTRRVEQIERKLAALDAAGPDAVGTAERPGVADRTASREAVRARPGAGPPPPGTAERAGSPLPPPPPPGTAERAGSPLPPPPPLPGRPIPGAPVAPVPQAPDQVGSPGSPPAEPTLAAVAVPSREELTKAWGDAVLPGLPARIRAYLASGRFVAGGPDAPATYAVPDRGLLTRAQTMRQEIEVALAAHFGRPVPLALVLDDGPPPGRPATGAAGRAPGGDEDVEVYDLDDLADAGPAVVSPKERLLRAFPGAEEVTP